MKFLHKVFVALTLLSILPIASIVSAVGTRDVTVYVMDANDSPVPAISITLVGPSSYSSTATTSSTTGSTIFDDISNDGEYTATISLPSSSSWKLKSGESSSKSVLIDNNNTSQEITFNVEKKQQSATEDPKGDNPSILDTDVPGAFRKVGSLTTKFSELDADSVDSVEGLIFDDPTANKIEYLDDVDLSDDSTAEKFEDLDKYVDVFTIGRVFVDSDSVPELNKRAEVTLREMDLVSGASPLIVEDGNPSTKVSNVSYDGVELTFEVSGFSTYAFRPTILLDNEDEEVNESQFLISGEVDDLNAKIDIYNGEELIAEALEPDRQGKFEIGYSLENESNEFKVLAFSENGETAEANFDITFIGGEQNDDQEDEKKFPIWIIPIIIVVVGVGGYFGYKYLKKKKGSSKLPPKAEKLLESDNPKMPEVEKEDLLESKIGHTEINSTDEETTDKN